MKTIAWLFICFVIPAITFALVDGEEHVVTNVEYRKFVEYVRDSIARKTLGEEVSSSYVMRTNPDRINWKKKIVWNYGDQREALVEMFYPEHERFLGRIQLDTRKLIFDYIQAEEQKTVKIYPDTLIWMRKSTDPEMEAGRYAITSTYNWHPYFNDYPVMGLNEEQRHSYLFWLNHPRPGSGIKSPKDLEYLLTTNGEIKEDAKHGISVTVEPGVLWEIKEEAYRGFVNYVRDSLARRILGETVSGSQYFNFTNDYGDELDPPTLRWDVAIPWDGEEESRALVRMYFSDEEGISNSATIDIRKLNFEYHELDLAEAAKPEYVEHGWVDRSLFIVKDIVSAYPDTIIWRGNDGRMHEIKMSVGDPYGYYPENVEGLGIGYDQAEAFYRWVNRRYATATSKKLMPFVVHLFPSWEQWEALVHGKLPKQLIFDIEYPDEIFRYTVRKVIK